MKKSIFLALIVILSLHIKKSNAQFTVQGEVRPRTEYRHGFKRLANDQNDPALFTEQRSRLYFGFKEDKLELKISVQDVRMWGGTSQIYKVDPALTNLNLAWAKYHFNQTISLKVGRQELNYNNARFLGNLGWAQQSRSHDLFKLEYNDSLFNIHMGLAFNQDANIPEFGKLFGNFYSGVNNYKVMQFLWANYTVSGIHTSFLFLNNGFQAGDAANPNIYYSQTIGGIANYKTGDLSFEGEAYVQLGKDGVNKDLSAFLLAANATYYGVSNVDLTGGFDFLSGTSEGSAKNNSFTPLYGTNHKFYGFMDYFYVGNAHSQNGRTIGLIDVFIKSKIKVGESGNVIAHLHEFVSPVEILDPLDNSNSLSNVLGTEVDLVYSHSFSKTFNLSVGYSQMFGSTSLEAIKGGDVGEINNWAWLMLTFKPVFFNSAK